MTLYLWLPLFAATVIAVWAMTPVAKAGGSRDFVWRAALFCFWVYFSLNHAFFHWPWPWQEWTGRTPNGLWFSICVIGLTLMIIVNFQRLVLRAENAPESGEVQRA